LNPRRPSRGQGGPSRGSGGNPNHGDDTPAQTNLGLLLQRALQQAQQSAQTDAEDHGAVTDAIDDRETKLCSNCWNAVTYKGDTARMMARCSKDLWIRPSFTLDELNAHKVRRWYADCPEYDDSE